MTAIKNKDKKVKFSCILTRRIRIDNSQERKEIMFMVIR